MTNNDLIALLAEVQENLARHVFGPESPACVMCGGESGFDVGRACPQAHDYDLLQRVKLALEEPVENVPLREENAALRALLRADHSNEDWRAKYLAEQIKHQSEKRLLGELLAVLNGDGGQYAVEHSDSGHVARKGES
jgi:hypothetical protein